MFDLEEGLAIDHQYDRSPAVPRPGKPVVLRVSTPPSIEEVAVIAAVHPGPLTASQVQDLGRSYPARRVAGHWEAVIPGMGGEATVHYVVRATGRDGRSWHADGKRPEASATVFTHRVTDRRPPAWTHNAVVYQIFVDRFANASGPVEPTRQPNQWAGGDVHGVTAALPYLEDLGVNTVWLTPIFSAKSYHGYDTTDLYDVDERFGGKPALEALIEAAAGRNIRVVLDFVPNHLSNLHPWFIEAQAGGPKRDWFFINADGSYAMFFSSTGMPKVNLNNPEAQQAMIDAARYWVDEFGIAGYRIDHVLGPEESFFAAMSTQLNAVDPELWLFGEATATPAFCRRYGSVLDGATDFLFAYALRDYMNGELSATTLAQVEQEAAAALPHEDFAWVRFVDNHDMSRALHHWDDDLPRLERATQALFDLPGVPSIFYGTEQGLTHEITTEVGGLEVGRVPMQFDPNGPLVAPLRQMIQQRLAKPIDPAAPVFWSLEGAASWEWSGRSASLQSPDSCPLSSE